MRNLEKYTMIHHSTTRNRSKGFKIKRILQVALLLGVALWLVYQIKHSYDEDQKKLSTGVGDLNLGRKGNPGTENSVTVDSNGSDTTEQNEGKGGDNDTNEHVGVNTKYEISFTDADPDANTEEEVSNKGSQESQQDSSLNGEKQILQEKHVDIVDDSNVKSNDDETRKDKVDGKDVLQLPSQMDDDRSSGKIEDGTGGTTSNGLTKISPGNQIEQNSDPSENASERGDNAKSESGESSNVSLDAQTSEGDAIRLQEGAENANSVSETQNNSSSTEDSENANSVSDVQNNASLTKDEVTNDSKPDAENANSVSDAQTNASPTKDELTNDSKLDAENVNSVSHPHNGASPTEDEATNGDNAGQQEDGVSDKQNTDNQTAEVANTDNTKSEDDVDSSKPNPENNRVMPTNYEASIKDSFETQGDNAPAETTDNSSSEKTKAVRPDEDSSSDAQNNSNVSVTENIEAMNSQDDSDKNADMTSNEENAKENKIPDTEIETKSDPEDSISSQTAHGEANSEMKGSSEIESQLSNINGLLTANSNAETMQGDDSSASSFSSEEVSQAAKLRTRRATQKNRKKQRHHKLKE